MKVDALPDAASLAGRLGARVVVHRTVSSTMDAARDDPGPAPAVHLAERQDAGRGRHGRVWASPPGNLYATIAWPDAEGALPPGILAAIQLAWSRAVEAAGGPRTTCKWPNDGLLGEGKWAGALAASDRGPAGRRLLVGLGANLTVAPDLPGESPAAVALAERWRPWPGRGPVVTLLLEAAVGVLRGAPRGVADALEGWDRRDALRRGAPIALRTPRGVLTGRYAGVAPDGRLRLSTDDGETIHVAAAEVVRTAPPKG